MQFYSVDMNRLVVASVTDQDIILWNILKIKVFLEVLEISNSEDVTSVRFHPDLISNQRVQTYSIDYLLKCFWFGITSMKMVNEGLETIFH